MAAKRKILVVEDNALNRSLLCEILRPGYDVVEAENGREALDCLRRDGGGFDLILLDIVMPVMNGYEFLAEVKKDPALSAIPVIVTTQNDGESEEVTALSCGAADFTARPFSADRRGNSSFGTRIRNTISSAPTWSISS